jgi:protein-S-isoprenylcysteine O-methyltransferase Ste14
LIRTKEELKKRATSPKRWFIGTWVLTFVALTAFIMGQFSVMARDPSETVLHGEGFWFHSVLGCMVASMIGLAAASCAGFVAWLWNALRLPHSHKGIQPPPKCSQDEPYDVH